MSSPSNGSDAVPAGRPRLNLKPRDEAAARKADEDRQQKAAKANPFGAAKPREAILAERCGKSEVEILQEAAKTERVKLRLTPEQATEKRAAEEAIDDLKEQLELETDPAVKATLQADLDAKKKDMESLLDKFEALLVEAAKKGELPRPSERKQQLEAAGEGGYGAGGGRGRGDRGGYGDRPYGGGYGARDGRGGGAAGGRGYGGGGEEGGRPRGFTNYNTPKTGGFDDEGDGAYRNFGGGGDRRGGFGDEGAGGRRGGGFNDGAPPRSFGDEGGRRGGGSGGGGFGGYEEAGGFGGGRGGGGGRRGDDESGFGSGYGTGGRGGRGGGRGGGGGGGRDSPSEYPGMGTGSGSSTYVDYQSPYSQDRF